MEGADLNRASLSGVELSDANLIAANLSDYTSLRNANLRGAT